ncbi:uncharacterized protein V1510DRAFT_404954 [Dipodascopsis tothii]|uniref:uncharacterized protein n=1 Tax=Dipodascopsis tothii TaxID=44089 RepID=UPI0034CD4843
MHDRPGSSLPPPTSAATISAAWVLFYIAFLLWQILLACLIVKPAFYRPSQLTLGETYGSAHAVGASDDRLTRFDGFLGHFFPYHTSLLRPRFDHDADCDKPVPMARESRRGAALTFLAPAQRWQPCARARPRVPAGAQTVYKCRRCQAHFADGRHITSKAFQGRIGPALLVAELHNVREGPPGDRMLITGMHTLADVRCVHCELTVGWRYLAAYDRDQAYKIGQYILELERVCRDTALADDGGGLRALAAELADASDDSDSGDEREPPPARTENAHWHGHPLLDDEADVFELDVAARM